MRVTLWSPKVCMLETRDSTCVQATMCASGAVCVYATGFFTKNAHHAEIVIVCRHNPAPHISMLDKICAQLGFNEKRPFVLGVCFASWQH